MQPMVSSRVKAVMRGLLWLWMFPMLAVAAPATQPVADSSACRALASSWADRFRAADFDSVVAPPFIIAGNGGRQKLTAYRDGTVVAAQKALSAMYFKTPPDQPILILLFEDHASYEKLALKWFNDRDVPHYGFYRNGDRTLLMDVSTGTGTLVHELTHALIAPDFPDVPDWFNEGLASLYEQCHINGKTIAGLPNWRLPALQKAIRDGTLRPLSELIQDENFRDDKLVGINYAQARYLMHYLQDRGQLQDFYKSFRDGHEKDPTGIESLKTLIAPQSLDQFDKNWRDWVLTLRFER